MESQAVEQPTAPRKAISYDGVEYASRSEYMKYLMRRRRDSLLPHYPHLEPNRG